MAEQKPRAPRARKKSSDADEVAPKAVTRKKPATTARRRAGVARATEPGEVAVRAYYLWEQGEPGDADAHWLRAEQELQAA